MYSRAIYPYYDRKNNKTVYFVTNMICTIDIPYKKYALI